MQFTLPLISALLVSLWFLVLVFFLIKPFSLNPKKIKKKFDLIEYLGLEKIEEEAKNAGWNISKREFLLLISFSVALGSLLALVTKNPLIFIAGIVAGYYLPRFLLEKYKRGQKEMVLKALPDPLRMMVSRLPDFGNITKAIEVTQRENIEPVISELFDNFIKDIAVGANVTDALNDMKKKVKLKNFDSFVENLIMAHEEGFTDNALKALEKSIEIIESNLTAIEIVKIQSKKKKQNLYVATATAWFFPVILSAMHTGEENIYLSSLPGKILMFLFVLGTIYNIVKSEDYLSLRLEEL